MLLKIKNDFDYKFGLVSTYHQLGRLSEQHQQWDIAEDWYFKAVEIPQRRQFQHANDVIIMSISHVWRFSNNNKIIIRLSETTNISQGESENILEKTIGSNESLI